MDGNTFNYSYSTHGGFCNIFKCAVGLGTWAISFVDMSGGTRPARQILAYIFKINCSPNTRAILL
jgi:hypothetical protein